MELIRQILQDFNENKYTIRIVIDSSKAFDTADYDALLKKINMYGIKGEKLKIFSQLSNKKLRIKLLEFVD